MTPTVYQNLADKINELFLDRKVPFVTAAHAQELWMQMLHHQMIDATMPPEAVRAGTTDDLHGHGPLGKPLSDDAALRLLQAQDDVVEYPNKDLTDEQFKAVQNHIAQTRNHPGPIMGDYQGSVLYPATIAYVAEFHEKFGHPIAGFPTISIPELRALRVRMLLEEVLELAEASAVRCSVYPVFDMNSRQWRYEDANGNPTFSCEAYNGPVNMVEMADAIGDIDYLAAGASLVFGFPQCQIVEVIHASNMSKLGEDGKPVLREDGKILKGPNYWKPQAKIKALLDERINAHATLEIENGNYNA